MNNTEISNELMQISGELSKANAILKSLGTSAMYDTARLLEDEQRMLAMGHKDNSDLYHASMDYLFNVAGRLNALIKTISEGRTGEE